MSRPYVLAAAALFTYIALVDHARGSDQNVWFIILYPNGDATRQEFRPSATIVELYPFIPCHGLAQGEFKLVLKGHPLSEDAVLGDIFSHDKRYPSVVHAVRIQHTEAELRAFFGDSDFTPSKRVLVNLYSAETSPEAAPSGNRKGCRRLRRGGHT
jgi:hypothetical protein